MSKSVNPAIVGALTDVTTTQYNPLGMRAVDVNGDVYVYVLAGAAIAQYNACKFNGSALGYDDVRPTSAVNQVVLGVAQVAIASGSYGWIMETGVPTCLVTNSTAAGVPLVSSSTAGLLTTLDTTAGNANATCRPIVALVSSGSSATAGTQVAIVR